MVRSILPGGCPVCVFCPVCRDCNIGVLWPNGGTDQDETWHAGMSRPWPHCVRWGPRTPPKGQSPPTQIFYICCGQMARWIKMPLRGKIGLDPSDIVLDGPQLPSPQNGAQPPILGPCLLGPNGWMDQDVTWYKDRPRPRPHCVTWGPSSLPKGAQPPILGPYLLWPNGRPSQLLLNTCYN